MKMNKTVSIVFTKSKKKFPIGSLLIRWWSSKGFFKLHPYSHVARATVIRDWGYRYFQASEGKVNYEFETFFRNKHHIVKQYDISVSKEIDKEIKKKCYEEAGNTYAMAQNIGIFLTDVVMSLFGRKLKNPWTRGRNCSEILYAKCFKVLLPDLNYNENKIKPHEIEEIILENFEQLDDGCWVLKGNEYDI
jgi:hypothetical protein